MAVKHPQPVTDDAFVQEIERHSGLALVDFWATWCSPCHLIAPVIAQIADEYDGRVKVAKLDVDENQQTAMRYNVRSIPSVLLFKNGTVVETVVGAVPKPYLVERIERHLK
ncbi:MAG: thioredoxin [Gemmatimonadetes bacterium]|nr:thioredoxin [Gemmatimonadota bacterium]